MQSNQNIIDSNFNIIDVNIWETLYNKFINKNTISDLDSYIQEISINYNIDKKNIIKEFINYIIRNKKTIVSSNILRFIENIMHYQECKNSQYIHYSLSRLSSFVSKDL
jgi:hypothetical protein